MGAGSARPAAPPAGGSRTTRTARGLGTVVAGACTGPGASAARGTLVLIEATGLPQPPTPPDATLRRAPVSPAAPRVLRAPRFLRPSPFLPLPLLGPNHRRAHPNRPRAGRR